MVMAMHEGNAGMVMHYVCIVGKRKWLGGLGSACAILKIQL